MSFYDVLLTLKVTLNDFNCLIVDKILSGQSTFIFGQLRLYFGDVSERMLKKKVSEESSPRQSSKWPPSSPRFPAPALACSVPRISPTATHTASGRQLASYQGKWKHTLLHTPLLGRGEREGGKKCPCFDWTADSELCLKIFHLNPVGDIEMGEMVMPRGAIQT